MFKILNVYVTEQGMKYFASNFLRIINLILLSWLINLKNILPKKFEIYQQITEDVIEFIPQVFKIFKDKRKIKHFFRYILTQIKMKN